MLDTNVPNVVALEKDTRFIPTLKVRTPSPISNPYPSSDTDWCAFSNWQMPRIIGSRYSKAMLWKCLILKSWSWREYRLRQIRIGEYTSLVISHSTSQHHCLSSGSIYYNNEAVYLEAQMCGWRWCSRKRSLSGYVRLSTLLSAEGYPWWLRRSVVSRFPTWSHHRHFCHDQRYESHPRQDTFLNRRMRFATVTFIKRFATH